MVTIAELDPVGLLAAAKAAEADYVKVATKFDAMAVDDVNRRQVYGRMLWLKLILDGYMDEIERRMAVARAVDAVFEELAG